MTLADYRTDDVDLVKPDEEHGRPGLLPARDPMGREVLVKLWPRIGGADQGRISRRRRSLSSSTTTMVSPSAGMPPSWACRPFDTGSIWAHFTQLVEIEWTVV